MANQQQVVLEPTSPLSSLFPLLDDDPDNRILECAAAVEADYIVTGDKHLLSLQHFRDIPILKLSDFIEVLDMMRPWQGET